MDSIASVEHQGEEQTATIDRIKALYKANSLNIISQIIPISKAKENGNGYVASHPEVLIDTLYDGTKAKPKVMFSLIIDKYSINKNGSVMPCKGCVFIEGKVVQKRSSWLILKLNKGTLQFERWNN